MDTLERATPLIRGRYQICEELLRCRFSTLYQGMDSETWTPLVIRKLDAPPGGEEARIQFLREGHALERLVHRNLPRVLACVEEGGDLFMLMEPFDGTTLDYIVDHLSAPPDWFRLVRWMDQIAAGLEYLHAQDPPIVYRDLQPRTLAITSRGVIKLVDFGLAKLVMQVDAPVKTMFLGMGTDAYAAPEQLASEHSRPTMDLYALGATFYRLASGREPVAAIARISDGPLPSIRVTNPGLLVDFETLILHLMSLDPTQRPASATEVRARLKEMGAAVGMTIPDPTRRLSATDVPTEQPWPPPAPAAVQPAPEPPPVEAPAKPPSPARKLLSSLKLPWFGAPVEETASAPETEPAAADVKVPFVDLASLELTRDVGLIIPETIARRIQGVCIGRPTPKELTIAVKDPTQVYIYDHINYTTQGQYGAQLVQADAGLIDLAAEYYYKVPPRLHDMRWLAWLEKKRFVGVDVSLIQSEDALLRVDDLRGPAIEAVDRLIKEAISIRASDIHIESFEKEVVLRYRVDGILHVMDTWARKEAAAYVKRVKILANMDIAQDLVPQGGRISVRVEDNEFDLRVSCVPVPDGESVVMRLLNKGTFNKRLEDLGFSSGNLASFRHLVGQPHGMILVSGPTGSGKSTTLYAALAEINRPDRKILTIEDPIEYKMPGVVQLQVNMAPREAEKRLTFARALREFLRQDPDVILVGEIRDDETAAISVQAALTGHLLLSTIHTNDAAGIVTRLRDRGVEPYLVSSTLSGGIAQRLVRTICVECKEEVAVPTSAARIFEKEGVGSPRMFRGKGCKACHGTGYRGRLAIYEVLVLDAEIRELIATEANAGQIYEAARGKGFRSLYEDGLEKVVGGTVPLEEVQRVCLSD